jgi:hypothetical protein
VTVAVQTIDADPVVSTSPAACSIPSALIEAKPPNVAFGAALTDADAVIAAEAGITISALASKTPLAVIEADAD